MHQLSNVLLTALVTTMLLFSAEHANAARAAEASSSGESGTGPSSSSSSSRPDSEVKAVRVRAHDMDLFSFAILSGKSEKVEDRGPSTIEIWGKDNHALLQDAAFFTLQLQSFDRANAWVEIKIDGDFIGYAKPDPKPGEPRFTRHFIYVKPGEVINIDARMDKKRFQFFDAKSEEAKTAGAVVGNPFNGVVEVIYWPERSSARVLPALESTSSSSARAPGDEANAVDTPPGGAPLGPFADGGLGGGAPPAPGLLPAQSSSGGSNGLGREPMRGGSHSAPGGRAGFTVGSETETSSIAWFAAPEYDANRVDSVWATELKVRLRLPPAPASRLPAMME